MSDNQTGAVRHHRDYAVIYPAQELRLKARSNVVVEVVGLPRREAALVRRRDLPPEVELINLREHPAAREILNSFKARDLYLSGSLTCLVRRSSNCAPPGGDQWEVLS